MVVLCSKTCQADWWMFDLGNMSVLTGRDWGILRENMCVYRLVDADELCVRVRVSPQGEWMCQCECQPRSDQVILQHVHVWRAGGCVNVCVSQRSVGPVSVFTCYNKHECILIIKHTHQCLPLHTGVLLVWAQNLFPECLYQGCKQLSRYLITY